MDLVSERKELVLAGICSGLTDAEISALIHRSQRTAKHYRDSLKEEFDAKNTAELVSNAWETKAINADQISKFRKTIFAALLLVLPSLNQSLVLTAQPDFEFDFARASRRSREISSYLGNPSNKEDSA